MQQPLKDQIRHVLLLQLYFLYLVLHYVQEFIRNLVKTHILKEENQPGKARVSRIIFKHKLDPEEISKRQDFVTSHGTYADISILDNPLWHLYCVENSRVFFVLLPREISYYRLGNFPFMFVPIFEEALAVAEVLKEDFLKLGEQFNKEKCPKTILFTNTARCGSTLMGKMLDHPGNTVCWAEAHSLCNLAIGLDEGIFTEQECKELLQATIACLRAHVPKDQIAILKTTSTEARLVRLCGDIPNLKHMFMFRKKGLPSVEKVVRRESFMIEILIKIYNYSPPVARFISMLQPAMEGHFVRKLKPDDLRGLSAIVYASPYSHYLKNQHLYSHPVVWYHDVIENTAQTLTDLFEALDIPVSCVQKAIDCKKEDSQKNSFLSWESLGHVKIPPMTEQERMELVRYAQVMGVPEDTFDC